MRILDLGAHDGFIARWLLDQFPDAHIDAIELNSHAAAKCAERINGTCKVAHAEHAPDLFEPGTYDAVVALELIEHVPDTARFLDACERMLKPDGRVFISTPDGCFGTGGNPHHLRALRAVDLADLLRRRGELVDMHVGSDGVTVAAYQPRPRREDVAIFTGPGWQKWSPTDIEHRGLGGSETAAVRLADALTDLGFIVTVYGDVEDCCFRQTIFRHWSTFDPMDRRGALIASRIPQVADRRINAAVRFLWLHDTDCGADLTPRRAEEFDYLLCLSGWHEQHLRGRYPFAADRLIRTRNAIHRPYFRPRPWAERAQRLIYTSSPDRGLDVLLEEWPRVREHAPEAVFSFCYAAVYDVIADQDPAIGQFRDRIRELADQPGVQALGALPQPVLAELMCTSRVWAHPSWSTPTRGPFHETYCVGCVEAQAAGCHVVASDWGALSNHVKYGRLVNSDPPNARWRDGLVTHIVEGLTNPEVGQKAVEQAPVWAREQDWEGVAVQVGKLIAAADRGRR